MSRLCAQKLARLQAIVAERTAWTNELAQIKRMHGWVLSVEHLLDGSWAQEAVEVSNATVASRLDGWREQMAEHLTDGSGKETMLPSSPPLRTARESSPSSSSSLSNALFGTRLHLGLSLAMKLLMAGGMQ